MPVVMIAAAQMNAAVGRMILFIAVLLSLERSR